MSEHSDDATDKDPEMEITPVSAWLCDRTPEGGVIMSIDKYPKKFANIISNPQYIRGSQLLKLSGWTFVVPPMGPTPHETRDLNPDWIWPSDKPDGWPFIELAHTPLKYRRARIWIFYDWNTGIYEGELRQYLPSERCYEKICDFRYKLKNQIILLK